MTYTRLFADTNGDSHFEGCTVDMDLVHHAPPAPAPELSQPSETARHVWLRFPDDREDAAHPSPRRQLCFILEGIDEGWTSKDETRMFRARDRLVMEETSGKGHGARPVQGAALAVTIALE
ncbi:MAG: cupin domain-containing protein [Pseudomonadota bacterium]